MLGDGEEERQRLSPRRRCSRGEARALLDRLDIPVGGDVIDIACGPIGILPLLSERGGPHGEVTGLDTHAEMLEQAARTCRSLGNVRFVLADATATGLTERSFDLAHIRLLLVNVPDPGAVLREAVSLMRPSGTVAVQEVDWLSWQCEPAIPEWDALRTMLLRLWHSRGLDPCIGRRLPTLLRAAGLREVRRGPRRLRLDRPALPALAAHVRRALPGPAARRRNRDGRRVGRARVRRAPAPGPPGDRRRAGDDRTGLGPRAGPGRPGRAGRAGVAWRTDRDVNDGYLLENRAAEAGDRFAALSDTFDEWTRRRLLALGLRTGWSCWEVGAGGPRVPDGGGAPAWSGRTRRRTA